MSDGDESPYDVASPSSTLVDVLDHLVRAFALAFHALSYWVDGRQLEQRTRRRYQEEQDG